MTLDISPILIGAIIIMAIGLVVLVGGDRWGALPFWLRNLLVIVFVLGLIAVGLSLLQ